MRRKDREMDQSFALGIVDSCEYAVLSMVLGDGTPYGVPLTIAREGNSIYFHSAQEGKKADALRQCGRVSLACVGRTHRMEYDFTTEFESAIVSGTAQELTGEEEKIHALRLICQRHTPKNMGAFDAAIAKSLHRTAVWRITIEDVTGKRKKYDAKGVELKFGRMEDDSDNHSH